MSFWDDFKDLFKTRQQLEEEKANKLKEATTKAKSIESQLKELEDLYESTQPKEASINELFPIDSGLKEIEYTPSTDEEIASLAESIYKGDYEEDKNLTNAKYSKKLNDLSSLKDFTTQEKQESIDSVREQYENLKENAKNKAIKNGISRSSILNENLNDLSTEGKHTEDITSQKYQTEIDAVDNELTILSAERENALNALDLKYAGDVKEKIDNLTKERDNLVKKYAEYNDKVREKQQNYNIKRQENIADYYEEKAKNEAAEYEYELKNGYSGDKKDNYEQRFSIASEFYNSLPADIAIDALEASPNMKYYLGIYYDTLHETLSEKKIGLKKYY